MTNDELKTLIKLVLQVRAKKRPELYKLDDVNKCHKCEYVALVKKFSDEMLNICQDAVVSDNYIVLALELVKLIESYERGVAFSNERGYGIVG